jgi:hypothetical protein
VSKYGGKKFSKEKMNIQQKCNASFGHGSFSNLARMAFLLFFFHSFFQSVFLSFFLSFLKDIFFGLRVCSFTTSVSRLSLILISLFV